MPLPNNILIYYVISKMFHLMQYYLKAQFQFSKNQFADLMLIVGFAGMVSQVQRSSECFWKDQRIAPFPHFYKQKMLNCAASSDAHAAASNGGGMVAKMWALGGEHKCIYSSISLYIYQTSII